MDFVRWGNKMKFPVYGKAETAKTTTCHECEKDLEKRYHDRTCVLCYVKQKNEQKKSKYLLLKFSPTNTIIQPNITLHEKTHANYFTVCILITYFISQKKKSKIK